MSFGPRTEDAPLKPEDCPVRLTLEIIGGKWKSLILNCLARRTMRFHELRKMIPGARHKVLAQQLRELERAGIVQRRVYPEVPPRVDYRLTAQGRALRPVLETMSDWGMQYRAEQPQADE